MNNPECLLFGLLQVEPISPFRLLVNCQIPLAKIGRKLIPLVPSVATGQSMPQTMLSDSDINGNCGPLERLPWLQRPRRKIVKDDVNDEA